MAVEIDLKFATLLNPEDCSIEDLEAQIAYLEKMVGFYETKQLAIKKFINSIYGALGSKYFVAYNTAMAESITAQGRDLNHFSEISVNEYFEGIWQNNPQIVVYYQWRHTTADGNHIYFKDENKPDDYYERGEWIECESWDKAVKKGKQVTSDISDAYNDNSVHRCDWLKIKTGIWEKMNLVPQLCKSYTIDKGKTTDTGPLLGEEFDYLNGKTESMTIGGDTDSIYVEFGRIIAACAPKSIYWGVSPETQREVYARYGCYPQTQKEIVDPELRKKVHRERAKSETKAIVDLWNYSMGPYMKNKYDLYAKKFNCDKNLQVLELEKISDVTMYFAKKRYAMSESWKEPGIFLPYMEEIIYKGIEIVKGTTPSYVRECMEDFVNFAVRWYGDNYEPAPHDMCINKLKEYKKIFMTKSPEEICGGCRISDYDKFILSDKNKLVFGDKAPAHVKAAGIYNFFLNMDKNKTYRMKYQPVKSADKIKWYYTTDKNYETFGFTPGKFPAEIALPIDREKQFEKQLLTFCNKVMSIMGYQPMTSALCYSAALF